MEHILCDDEPEEVQTSENVLITAITLPPHAVSTTQSPISVDKQDPIETPLEEEEEERKRKIRKLTKAYQDGDIDKGIYRDIFEKQYM